MHDEKSTASFEDYKIRRVYDETTETWYFSVVDIIQALLQQPDFQAARNYWKVLKNRLNKEGNESVTKCNRLKLEAADGKKYLTDVASPETLLRLIAEVTQATGMAKNKVAGKKGGGIARKARRELEDQTGKSVVTGESFLPPGGEEKLVGD